MIARGGVIECFRASNLVMRNISDAAFSITAAYGSGEAGANAASGAKAIPHMRHFSWGDVSVVNAKKVADLSGLAGSPLEDFRLSDVQAAGAEAGIRCENATDVALEEISLQARSGPAVEVRNVKNLEMLRLAVEQPNEDAPVVVLNRVTQALVHECKVAAGSGVFVRFTGATNQDIAIEGNRLAGGVEEREP